MPYYVFLDGVQLPVAPSKISMKIKNQNKTINLINGGEYNLLKTPGLTEFSFEALLPQVRYPFATYPEGFKEAYYYLDKLEKLKIGKKPFWFKVVRALPSGKLLFNTNYLVSLEDYEVTEDAKEGFDVKVKINLKHFREFGTKYINIVNQSNTEAASPVAVVTEERPVENPPTPKTYVVKKGDCLWNIAKKYLGNGARYTEIYELNKDKIKNPNLIYPGQELILPDY